ncbi:hypothetical protein FACS1894166_07740 [Bacilli bacterium]|nr:hypothetical protein FACS1894166_07740 [Bacilli bacterium]
MMVNGLRNSYALVLFNIAMKKDALQIYYDTIHELLHVFNKHPELNDFLNDTAVSKETRKQLVNDLFQDKIDHSILYFL